MPSASAVTDPFVPFEKPEIEKVSPCGSVSLDSTAISIGFPAVVVAESSFATTELSSTSPTTTVTVAVS